MVHFRLVPVQSPLPRSQTLGHFRAPKVALKLGHASIYLPQPGAYACARENFMGACENFRARPLNYYANFLTSFLSFLNFIAYPRKLGKTKDYLNGGHLGK